MLPLHHADLGIAALLASTTVFTNITVAYFGRFKPLAFCQVTGLKTLWNLQSQIGFYAISRPNSRRKRHIF